MTPSKKCFDLIKQFEGFDLSAYLDIAGVPTIGWGTISRPDGTRVKMGDTCTVEEAEEYIQYDVAKFAAAVQRSVTSVLNQNQFDALVSFTYNLGSGALIGSTLLKLLNKNPDDTSIMAAFMMWDKAKDPKTKKLVPSNGLKNRRTLEAQLYFS